MRVFHHPDLSLHDPQFFLMRGRIVPCFETPARAAALLEGARTSGLEIVTPDTVAPARLGSIHDEEYLRFLREGLRDWSAQPNAGPEIVPNMHPTPEMIAQGAMRGAGIVSRAGWYMADTACAIGEGTWASSLAAACCADAASRDVVSGARAAYAACRPPGHHAYAARAGGHCFLNNSALAAANLRAGGAARVAVLDIDSHHGNGTQGIFWDDASVLTVSVHGDPNHYYPWFVGHAHETGGVEGSNLNLPLPRHAGDGPWIEAVTKGAEAVRRFGAEALVLALGFDASKDEPLGFLDVSDDAFARAGAIAASLSLPTVIVQEGGYAVASLPRLLGRFLAGFSAG
ncbi:histone deacetylase family protein [Elioraea rosea]|uniref:histone deacetylase family protein n=1 Tax=Elioraea rosea TaxID=2492390 RepID=UPI0011839856|nr:histone deacetylase family protein [Elioraea rosea]